MSRTLEERQKACGCGKCRKALAMPFNDDMIRRSDLSQDVFALIHDLAHDHEGRDRWQYRERAQAILRQP